MALHHEEKTTFHATIQQEDMPGAELSKIYS